MSRISRASQDTLGRKCYHPSGRFAAFPRSALDLGVHARFEQQARLHGARPAVESDAVRLSYAQLNALANDIAHVLLADAGQVEPYVAVLTDHGAMNVAAPLGVLKAGRAFVPLDTQWPAARLRWVLDHCHTSVLLSSANHALLAREIARPPQRVFVLEDLVTARRRSDPRLSVDADAPAYILYTSGSTGRPKGVRHSHRSLSHEVLRLTNALHVCADDRQTLLRVNSAGAISDAFTALLNGAALCPIDVLESGTDGLARWIARERVTIWRSTPSLFRAVWGELPAATMLPDLRVVFLCGEPVHGSDIDACRTHGGPDCLFVNCLGSTECATVTLYFSDMDTEVEPGPVPIGYPVEDMDVHLVDESGAVITGADCGEIVVRSRYLAHGYVDEPVLTEQSFRDDAADAASRLYFSGDLGRRLDDGTLIYQGRRDSRANLNGRTFELAEVEMALEAMAGIRQAVAAVVEDARGVSHLVAYVVSDEAAPPSTTAMRLWLDDRVPSFVVPTRYIIVDRIPLTATGKADRRALPDPFAIGSAPASTILAPPRDEHERTLCGLWSELLGVPRVGIHDNFLELGGHSLIAAGLTSRIAARYGVSLGFAVLFEAPTVAACAAKLRRELGLPASGGKAADVEGPATSLRPAAAAIPIASAAAPRAPRASG